MVSNQPYDVYAPCMTFLQLRTVPAHRSVLEANKLARMASKEQLLVTTTSTSLERYLNNVIHKINQAMCTSLEDKLGVWVYLMVPYNLKPGLRKFRTRGERTAVKEYTAAHHGYVDSNESWKTVSRTTYAGALVTSVPEIEMNWQHQGARMHK